MRYIKYPTKLYNIADSGVIPINIIKKYSLKPNPLILKGSINRIESKGIM